MMISSLRRASVCVLVGSGLIFSPFINAANIIGLGDLAGGDYYSHAWDVSAEGTTVVGNSNSGSGYEAFIYQSGTMTGLGDLAGGGFFSAAYGVSADGSTVVGNSSVPSSINNTSSNIEAFVYQNGMMTGLGDLAGGDYYSRAWDASTDGSVIVGDSDSASGKEAFVYQDGLMVGLGDLAGGVFHSEALGVSADGGTVVGFGTSTSGEEAFIYQNGVMTGLGDLAGGDFYSRAHGVSADGNAVVGFSISAAGSEAFVHLNGTMTGLGDLAGGLFFSEAWGVSADGSTVVGISNSESDYQAALWEADGNGGYDLLSLEEKLFLLGADISLDGWTRLTYGFAISDDGNVIVGVGERNGQEEAFIVNLSSTAAVPLPATAWLFLSAMGGLIGLKRVARSR